MPADTTLTPPKPAATPPPPAAPVKPITPEPAAKTTPTPPDDDSDPWRELDEKVFTKTEPKPEEKADAKAPEKKAEATTEQPEKRGVEPKALRTELDRVKGVVKEKEDALNKLNARISELEQRGKDATALTEQLAAKEKALEEAQAELSAAKAEVGPEFKEKHEKPFARAAEYAKQLVQSLQVGQWVVNEESGAREWKPERAATWEDFAALYQLPAGKAAQQARQLFGEDWQLVLGQVTKLQEMNQTIQSALAEEKAGWKEKSAARDAEAARSREAYQTGVQKARDELIAAKPDLYDEDPNDPEGNEILKTSRAKVMEQPKTIQQAVKLAARNRLNAEVAMREHHRVIKLKEENAQLKAEIELLKKGKPGPGGKPVVGETREEDDGDIAGELRGVFGS
jgi:hypothetical protein